MISHLHAVFMVKKTAKITKKTSTKKTSKTTKKSKNENSDTTDAGIIIIDDEIKIDKSAELEARRLYLEEARSQEASSD